MKKFLFSLIAVGGTCISVLAQYYNMGQDPSSVRWRKLTTERFTIIYPQGTDSVAYRYASTLNATLGPVSHSMNKRPWRFTVVMHNQLCTSNGFVALAPRRIELYNMPSQSDFALDWYQSLALHETRHIVQFDKLGSHLGLVLHVLWGQQGVAALAGLSTPAWFFEGDAVATETALSNEGRGRSPIFNASLRAQLLDKKVYSYSKAMFGSYKDQVPNHYVLGYYLVANGRKKYGASMWSDAISPTSLLGNFGRPMRQLTYKGRAAYYRMTMNEMKLLWDSIKKQENYSNINILPHAKRSTFTNYRYPVLHQFSETNSIKKQRYYAVKSGFSNYEDFISIDEYGNENVVFRFGRHSTGDAVSVQKNMVAWIENKPDLRWEMRSWAEVMTYDLSTRKMRTLTHNTRYQAPAISPDATRIAVVEVSLSNKYSIKILDINTGEVLQTLETQQNEYPLTPRWKDNNSVVAVFIGQDGKRIASVSTQTGLITEYKSKSYEELSQPSFWNNFLMYISSYSGANNLYAYDTITKQTFRVCSVQYGMQQYSITPDNQRILFSNYTADGFEPVEIPLDKRQWIPIESIKILNDGLYTHLAKDEQAPPRLDTLPFKTYESKPYRRLPHFLNIHSWGLGMSYGEIKTDEMFNSISVLSQDKLSTTEIEAGYRTSSYFSAQKYATVRYMGLYPIFEVSGFTGKQAMFIDTSSLKNENTFNTNNLRTTMTVPFNLSKGVWSQSLYVQFSHQYSQSTSNQTTKSQDDIPIYNSTKDYNTLYAVVGYSQFYKSRIKDILPRLGWSFKIGTAQQLHPKLERTYFSTKLYLPGILKHHSIRLTADIQYKNIEIMQSSLHSMSDAIPIARGSWYYENGINYQWLLRTYTANYTFTLANPDLSIASLLYLKRMKVNLFFDYTQGTSDFEKRNKLYHSVRSHQTSFYSYGYELLHELHLFRLALPIDIGWRQSYSQGSEMGYSLGQKTELLLSLRLNDL